jgi:hypothetical protein
VSTSDLSTSPSASASASASASSYAATTTILAGTGPSALWSGSAPSAASADSSGDALGPTEVPLSAGEKTADAEQRAVGGADSRFARGATASDAARGISLGARAMFRPGGMDPVLLADPAAPKLQRPPVALQTRLATAPAASTAPIGRRHRRSASSPLHSHAEASALVQRGEDSSNSSSGRPPSAQHYPPMGSMPASTQRQFYVHSYARSSPMLRSMVGTETNLVAPLLEDPQLFVNAAQGGQRLHRSSVSASSS